MPGCGCPSPPTPPPPAGPHPMPGPLVPLDAAVPGVEVPGVDPPNIDMPVVGRPVEPDPPPCSFKSLCPQVDGACCCKSEDADEGTRCCCCCCCECPCECGGEESGAPLEPPPIESADLVSGGVGFAPGPGAGPGGEVPADTRNPWGDSAPLPPRAPSQIHCPPGSSYREQVGWNAQGQPVGGCWPPACPLPSGVIYPAGTQCVGETPAGWQYVESTVPTAPQDAAASVSQSGAPQGPARGGGYACPPGTAFMEQIGWNEHGQPVGGCYPPPCPRPAGVIYPPSMEGLCAPDAPSGWSPYSDAQATGPAPGGPGGGVGGNYFDDPREWVGRDPGAAIGTSKYPLSPPPDSTWPGAPNYLYITVGNPLPKQSRSPTFIPEAPVGLVYSGVWAAGPKYPSGVDGPVLSFTFQYSLQDDVAPDGTKVEPPPPIPKAPKPTPLPDEEPCEEVWLGLFFNGTHATWKGDHVGSSIFNARDEYRLLAHKAGAKPIVHYEGFTVSIPGLVYDPTDSANSFVEFDAVVERSFKVACNAICSNAKRHCDKSKLRIDMFGWSRGAVAALWLSNLMNRSDCLCPTPAGKVAASGFPIRYMGLLDPCDSSLTFPQDRLAFLKGFKSFPHDVDNFDSAGYGCPANVENVFAAYAMKGVPGDILFQADKVFIPKGSKTKGWLSERDMSHLPMTYQVNDYETTHGKIGYPLTDAGAWEDLWGFFKRVSSAKK
ncbi:MAG: hypothetical protein HMLKMBBP_03560 [Planctomycetes bacterium]|nr:hypothetical protein [Planctomycetota bacterium]